ncbi:MAG TPA: NUDIX domain-containing protein [Flavipsychrobacter sp.]|nr:NUDIX domain-containing protein [Flavipsychrobacter sp.]
MFTPLRFNVRVYGILLHNGHLLVNEEIIQGRKIVKFPGGGMELGEGTVDCLKREWKEELNLEILRAEHFYTTDFFQQSAFDNSQVLSVYYTILLAEIPEAIVNTEPNERTYWLPLTSLTEDHFTLPIDKVVAKLLVSR